MKLRKTIDLTISKPEVMAGLVVALAITATALNIVRRAAR